VANNNTTATPPEVLQAQALASIQRGANVGASMWAEQLAKMRAPQGGVDANAQPIAPVQPDDDD
jgi:hypothetical protein